MRLGYLARRKKCILILFTFIFGTFPLELIHGNIIGISLCPRDKKGSRGLSYLSQWCPPLVVGLVMELDLGLRRWITKKSEALSSK